MAALREVWMWNEWGHFWPLWGVDGPLGADDLGLSEGLDRDLREWHARWEYLNSRQPSWRWEHPDAQVQWEAEGDRLLSRLVTELDGRASVVRSYRFPEDEKRLRLRGRRVKERSGSRAGGTGAGGDEDLPRPLVNRTISRSETP